MAFAYSVRFTTMQRRVAPGSGFCGGETVERRLEVGEKLLLPDGIRPVLDGRRHHARAQLANDLFPGSGVLLDVRDVDLVEEQSRIERRGGRDPCCYGTRCSRSCRNCCGWAETACVRRRCRFARRARVQTGRRRMPRTRPKGVCSLTLSQGKQTSRFGLVRLGATLCRLRRVNPLCLITCAGRSRPGLSIVSARRVMYALGAGLGARHPLNRAAGA